VPNKGFFFTLSSFFGEVKQVYICRKHLYYRHILTTVEYFCLLVGTDTVSYFLTPKYELSNKKYKNYPFEVVEVLFERFPGLRVRRLVGNVRVLLVPDIQHKYWLWAQTKKEVMNESLST